MQTISSYAGYAVLQYKHLYSKSIRLFIGTTKKMFDKRLAWKIYWNRLHQGAIYENVTDRKACRCIHRHGIQGVSFSAAGTPRNTQPDS